MAKFCAKHETAYFKKGRMKNYAHPIDGTDPTEWCNAPEQDMSAMEESAEAGHLVEEAVKQGAKVESVVEKFAPQEIGLWWKEVGKCLRSGYTKDKAVEAAYEKKMLEVTGIKVGE